jgi:hypothetical protein
MLGHSPYDAVIDASEKACWQIEDVLPKDVKIDFTRPHLPDALADIASIAMLSVDDKLALNHLRGVSYMNLFAFVEEYIIGQIVNHAQAELFGDHAALRALLRFSEEEVKHQMLFKRYCAAFQRDLGRPVELLGAASEVANVILSNSPIAVMLVTLHLEIMTQRHFTDTVKDDAELDPLFTSILKHHWMEESQHARIDILELDKMLAFADAPMKEKALAEYFGILGAFDGLLAKQVEMDVRNLEQHRGASFADADSSELRARQHRSYRKDFLLMGMMNKKFIAQLEKLTPNAAAKVEEAAQPYQ